MRLTMGALVVLLLAAAGRASAQPPAGAQRGLDSSLTQDINRIGGASGAYVADLDTGQALFSYAAGVGRMPASVEKLYTTSTALLRFGPSATLSTTVRGVGSVDSAGVFQGTLFLVGAGDPTFGTRAFDRSWYGAGNGATLQHLVSNLIRATGLTAVRGAIVGDESYFDSRRGTPATGYFRDLADVEGELSALAYDRGFGNFTGSVAQPRPALYAAQQFAAALKAAGVAVPSHIYTGRTPSTANVLASVHSPKMATLILLTNAPSDNFMAEMLLKGLGADFGQGGSTAAGAAVVQSELSSQFGISPRLDDGSGLSRNDSTSPSQVVALLSHMASNQAFRSSLAVAGETGTLKDAAKGTAAQGNCVGKTGTLHDVANLAGYCRARDGHTLAFAFLANGIGDPSYVHAVEADDMAAAVARYAG